MPWVGGGWGRGAAGCLKQCPGNSPQILVEGLRSSNACCWLVTHVLSLMGSSLLWPQARSACVSHHGRLQAALPVLTVSRHFHVQVGGGGNGARTGCSRALASPAPLLASRPGGRTAQPASVCAGCLAPTLGVLGSPGQEPDSTPHSTSHTRQADGLGTLETAPPKDFTAPRRREEKCPQRGPQKSLFNSKHAGGGSAGECRLAFLFLWGKLSQFPVTGSEKAQLAQSLPGPRLWEERNGAYGGQAARGVCPSVWIRPCVDTVGPAKSVRSAATPLCVTLCLWKGRLLCPVLDVHTHSWCIICVFNVAFSRELALTCWKSNCWASNWLWILTFLYTYEICSFLWWISAFSEIILFSKLYT